MEIQFLGTGAAWRLPEHSCVCSICSKMRELGEERTRCSFVLRTSQESILVDCGPDIREQMSRSGLKLPDVVLITHEHGDHFLGLDELLAFRRSVPTEAWRPIPVYATEVAWKAIEVRFGYLLGSLIEKRIAFPGEPLEGTLTEITPFKTFHGPVAAGSVGYVFEPVEDNVVSKLVYTSDFKTLPEEPEFLSRPEILLIQAHWLNEPGNNRPNHMSLQRALDYIQRWRPKRAVYLLDFSDGDFVPGDPSNNFMKKLEPEDPLRRPGSGEAYPVPRCQAEWQNVVDTIVEDYNLPCPVFVAEDGLTVSL
jgi:phosphoribosyl 1,2-cyclic phosphate phosphodiesterase